MGALEITKKIRKYYKEKEIEKEKWVEMKILKNEKWNRVFYSYGGEETGDDYYSKEFLEGICNNKIIGISGGKGEVVQIGIYMKLSQNEIEDILGKFDTTDEVEAIYAEYFRNMTAEKRAPEEIIKKLKEEIKNASIYYWNIIYGYVEGQEDEYRKQYEINKNWFDKIEYDQIKNCVKNAIETGNHAAFAKYFLENGKTNKQLFTERLKKFMHDKNVSEESWYKMEIIDEDFWRDKEFNYKDENKGVYQKQTLRRWIKGTTLPEHDEIVQIGFYLHLSSDEVNKLLTAAGKPTLYSLDIFDAVSMYYLDKCKDERDDGIDSILKEVKNKINKVINDIFNDETIRWISIKSNITEKQLSEKEEEVLNQLDHRWMDSSLYLNNNLEAITYLKKNGLIWKREKTDSNKGKLYRNKNKLVYKEEIGWNIADEIESYRELLQKENIGKDAVSYEYTEYLTRLYEDKLSEKNDIDDFVDAGKFGDKYYIFTNLKRYGFLYKTLQFVNADEPIPYLKNVIINKNMLTVNNPMKSDTILGDENSEFINENIVHKILKFSDGKAKFRDGNKKNRCSVLDIIWRINKIDDKIFGSKGLKKVFQVIGGRECESNNISNQETKDKGYEFDLRSKQSAIKFAIAVGKEDELDKYLKYAGYNISNGNDKNIHRTDLLLKYASEYRDELIKEWWKRLSEEGNNEEITETQYKNEIRKEFPFIKLLMIISRDIQFCTTFYESPKWDFKGLKKDLIYFVDENKDEHIPNIWFKKYNERK